MADAHYGELKLVVAVPHPTTNFAPIWLLEALGYATEDGLDLTIECLDNPKAAVEAVIAGRSDTTFVNIVFTFLARDRGVPLCPYYAFVRGQNRAFSVPQSSPIKSLGELRGQTIGLHYNDPELFEYACAALTAAGVDPKREVEFKLLPGSPLDAPRMAAAIRTAEVQAVWQLDVLTGFMEAEGVPLRLLPSAALDLLTPSSSFNALDKNLEARPEAFGALGRAVAKATLFALTNPEAAIRLLWKHYPSGAPPAAEREQAFRRELAALKVRLAGQRIEGSSDPRWGAITEKEAAAYQEFLLGTGALKTRRDPAVYFSNDLVPYFNDFDSAPVIEAARKCHV